MFESIKRKLDEQNKDNDPKNMSLDFKLMFAYHIVMMILFGFRPIENPIHQAYLAIALIMALILASLIHKLKSNWSWPGLSFISIPSITFNIVFTYIFLAFASYAMTKGGNFPAISLDNIEGLVIESWGVILQTASNPIFTPWYLAGLGIAFMNSMVSLKLATLKKSEFEAQCRN
ncbi:hypothetical protein KJY73_20170 [Bowmanella sp. Y26]|uniref:hypothetical protein n=1 Tax=Bowmanella yangjiangensis TaxID=2811230 RepID=UPI001BDCF4C1|nr:hypothetical protein [Bowmanella yangjiangensis]MBT1065901.1 hypothetical protein [Bowmanella yangjiangensis]